MALGPNLPNPVTASIDAVQKKLGEVHEVITVSTKSVMTMDRRGNWHEADCLIFLRRILQEEYPQIKFRNASGESMEYKMDSPEAIEEIRSLIIDEISDSSMEIVIAVGRDPKVHLLEVLLAAEGAKRGIKVAVLGQPPQVLKGMTGTWEGLQAGKGVSFENTLQALRASRAGDPTRERVLHPQMDVVIL